jgi:hypothetical protein
MQGNGRNNNQDQTNSWDAEVGVGACWEGGMELVYCAESLTRGLRGKNISSELYIPVVRGREFFFFLALFVCQALSADKNSLLGWVVGLPGMGNRKLL